MRIIVILCSLFCTLALVADIQSNLQPAQMQEDLDVLRRALVEAHGGLYRFSTKAELDKQFLTARSKVDRPMPTLAFISVVSEALTIVRDGHMRLEYDDGTVAALATARLLPLRVASEAARIIVVYNDTARDETVRPGMELLSINGRPIAEVTALILSTLSGDGFIETGKAWRMARGFAENYWLFVDQSPTFAVTARLPGGPTVTATLDGVTTAERMKSVNATNAVMAANIAKLAGPREAVSLEFPRGDEVGILRVRTFNGETFPSSVGGAFSTLRARATQAVILDLRGNGGGVDEYGALLVSYFVATPFRYFDHIAITTIRPSFATWKASTFEDLKTGTRPAPGGGFLVLPQLHPGVAEQKPAATPFAGRLVVLIDGGTFSTAADVCAQLRSRTKATFVGEETGGGFEGNTSGLNAQIVLPNSRLKLKIQMYGYWNAVSGGQPGRGTLPDVTVVRTVHDVLAGIDPPMDRAIAIAKK
jgi:peptidase S41-like protein